MDAKEAKRILMSDADFSGVGEKAEKTAEALILAVEVLEKMIPKMPIGKSEAYRNGPDDWEEVFHLHCPVCDCMVSVSDYDDFDKECIDEYCPDCGQRISKEYVWEGEEEEEE